MAGVMELKERQEDTVKGTAGGSLLEGVLARPAVTITQARAPQQQTFIFSVLETERPRSGCQCGWFPVRPLFLGWR